MKLLFRALRTALRADTRFRTTRRIHPAALTGSARTNALRTGIVPLRTALLFGAPALALVLALLAGCQPHTAPPAGLGDPWPAPANDPQITVLAPELQEWLRFHPARIRHDADAPMQVEVPVRNLAERQYLIDYRILFFDGDDMAVTPTMGWRFMAIEANQTARLTAGAMSPDAANYRLEIKWAR